MTTALQAVPGHSVRVDHVRDYTDRAVRGPVDIARLVASAEAELLDADHRSDTVHVISALRRLVGIAGLAKATADRLEAGR